MELSHYYFQKVLKGVYAMGVLEDAENSAQMT